MNTGRNIKKIREFRGMTQKEMGMALGFDEASASPRMAQYEGEYRVPRENMLNKMAEVLQVDPRSIATPTGYTEKDMVYRVLMLEEFFPEMELKRSPQTGELMINLHNKTLNNFLMQWDWFRENKKKGYIAEEEYKRWKYQMNVDRLI